MTRAKSNFISNVTRWWPAIKRGVKKTLLYSGIAIGCFGLLAVVFWTANFYIARDRWETFKHAMFGEWEGASEQVSETTHELTDLHQLIETQFAGVDSVHLFANKQVTGKSLEVATGARFESILGLLKRDARQQWCDVSNHETSISHRIQLAVKYADADSIQHELTNITPDQLALLGVEQSTLISLSETHCQFDFFITD